MQTHPAHFFIVAAQAPKSCQKLHCVPHQVKIKNLYHKTKAIIFYNYSFRYYLLLAYCTACSTKAEFYKILLKAVFSNLHI
jgi:hypothetical protein